MNEGLALGLKSFAVAIGAFAFLIGTLEIITAIQEGRPVLLGIALTIFGLALLVPIIAKGMKEAIEDARKT